MSAAAEVWYRVEDRRYSVADEWGDHSYTTVQIHVREIPVLRHTPKGVWLEEPWNIAGEGKRFVLRDARKRWACPSKEEAMESFRARKQRQARILRARLATVEEALSLVGASTVEVAA